MPPQPERLQLFLSLRAAVEKVGKWPHGNFITSFGNEFPNHILRTGSGLYPRHLSTYGKRNKAAGQENGQMTRRTNAGLLLFVSSHQGLLMGWAVHLDA